MQQIAQGSPNRILLLAGRELCERRFSELPFWTDLMIRTGHGLRALGDGVLGKLSWKDEADSGLDFSRGDRRLLGVRSELCVALSAETIVRHENEAHSTPQTQCARKCR